MSPRTRGDPAPTRPLSFLFSSKKIPDNIVDEHSLLLYIKFCAERPKRDRKGNDIPGTFVGASQLKKLFFGALRIRKEQDANLPTLARTRPATSVIVYDSIKTRMDEALTREREGLVPEEDAPDIRANTWLSQVTEEQLRDVGFGFLAHRQLRLAVWSHLAWTAQHASGNRGDDFCALKLAELQPTVLKHPDKRTDIYAVLGMQSEEKAGKRGMRTVINPVYSTFIANAKPEMCPLGGFAFYFHYIYDEKKIIDTMKLDYKINKSWRQIRVLHGPKSPTTPFNEQNFYNLISKAYVHAGFTSRLKAHLARHLLGYRQESMGVDPLETSKLGWVRGQTYMDTYAPALPKTAILGAAGFRSDEIYNPVWRRVRVPEVFLQLVCPMAEEMREKVAGVEHLSGAFNHWEMVIELREYFFKCGAAIWQLVPNSTIFRLPAFQNADVRNWMTTGYPAQLSALQAAAGDPLEIERIQNVQLVRVLNGMRGSLSSMTQELRELRAMVGRRTAMFTPARGFSPNAYHRNALEATRTVLDHDEALPGTLILPDLPDRLTSTPVRQFSTSDRVQQSSSSHSVQQSSNSTPTPSRPESSPAPRLVTQVELVLPPLAAFFLQGQPIGMVHPVFGMRSARWVEDIFPAILRPALCWDVWCPSNTMEQFESIKEIWEVYSIGERICDDDGTRTKMKPPLKLVAQFFRHEWRSSTDKKEQNRKAKAWQRFREIPEWIEHAMTNRRISLEVAIQELEDLRAAESATEEPRGLNWLANHLANQRKEAVRRQEGESFNADPKASSTRSQEGESSNTDPTASDTTTTGKKRARAVDARRPGLAVYENVLKDKKAVSVIFNLSQIILLRQGSFLLVLLLDHDMGAPKLWQILSSAAKNRSLLHLTTTEGFQTDQQRQKTFIVGVDISIKIEAFVATLTAARVYHHGIGGQNAGTPPYSAGTSLFLPGTLLFDAGTKLVPRSSTLVPTWYLPLGATPGCSRQPRGDSPARHQHVAFFYTTIDDDLNPPVPSLPLPPLRCRLSHNPRPHGPPSAPPERRRQALTTQPLVSPVPAVAIAFHHVPPTSRRNPSRCRFQPSTSPPALRLPPLSSLQLGLTSVRPGDCAAHPPCPLAPPRPAPTRTAVREMLKDDDGNELQYCRRGVLAFPRRALLRQLSTVHGVSFEPSSPARLCMHAARSRAGFLLPPTCTISSLRPSLSPMYPFPPPPLVIAPFCEQLGDVPIPTSRTPTLNVSAIPRTDAEAHGGATAARFEAINPETMIFFLPPKVQICQWRRPTPSLCGEMHDVAMD
ncbi:hypothetical protein C8F04DRAFT_1399692 [Mycena alexandri]|uniref:Ndc10 domain-containing protein n=1 Tax=Mycena alexandri TaxID=1745969 RepID=A0AAD6SG78_9AGAR|nr:hypothetical protein C8F04DRAFT_1399692 [Mycena alexandri]